jgi:hypothetical protein
MEVNGGTGGHSGLLSLALEPADDSRDCNPVRDRSAVRPRDAERPSGGRLAANGSGPTGPRVRRSAVLEIAVWRVERWCLHDGKF